jgi:hypothetical protein
MTICASFHLTTPTPNTLLHNQGLVYNKSVTPDAKPRAVDGVWSELVRLFEEPLSKQGPKAKIDQASSKKPNIMRCPEELKNVLRKAYANKHDLNVELFNTLRECLAEEQVVDAFNVTADKDTKANDCARQKNQTTKKV